MPAQVQLTALIDPEPAVAGHRLAWLAAAPDGHPVGSAYLRVSTAEDQTHFGELEIQVHPAERRTGIGTQLLAAALEAARQDGWQYLLGQATGGSPGAGFFEASGFRRALTLHFARLDLAGVDLAALVAAEREPHRGYRLVDWAGMVPDALADSYLASRRATHDMPLGELAPDRTSWDLARLRRVVGVVADRGDLLHTVAVVDESDGAIVGFTELVTPAGESGDAQHYGTAVLPEHRGRGLARWMKVASIRHARERYPELAGLLTDTAEENRAMRRISDALGYRPTHLVHHYRRDL
ncbi:acetyltransferase [Kitasatospora sp. MMS16-BH015]|nr:GNAT family N-acetyltransferase [Kitasatospora sp. MMS16-BH015]AUG78347.1 acetyltransferase [Kitasatospora sp. MMS16-BH015]